MAKIHIYQQLNLKNKLSKQEEQTESWIDLFMLSFMSLVLGDISVKILLHGISEISCLYIFSIIISFFIFIVIQLQLYAFSPHPNGILRSREKEGAYTLCNSMDGTGEHYAK